MKRHLVLRILLLCMICLIVMVSLNAPAPIQAQDSGPTTKDTGEPAFPAEGSSPEYIEAPSYAGCTSPAVNWVTKAPLPQALYGTGVVSDGTYIYAVGGYAGSSSSQLARYDITTDAWTQLAPLPMAIDNALTVYTGGKIYVLGGNSMTVPQSTVQVYSISANSWSSGAAMPGPRQQMGGGYYNGKIYAVGGFAAADISSAQNQTWIYDIAGNSWFTGAPNMPASLAGPGSGVVNDVLYILGGRNSSGNTLSTVYRYFISAGSWNAGMSMPVAANVPGSAVYGSRIWLFGGGQPFNSPIQSPDVPLLANTQVYDPQTDSWATGPALNVSRSFVGAAAVGNQIITVGGWTGAYSPVVETLTQDPMKILIVYSDVHIIPNSLRFNLMGQPGVGQVDLFDAQTSTPSLVQLKYYDIVISFSNTPYSNAAVLGDVLADYSDSGGAVAVLTFSFYNVNNNLIAGRWQSGGYSPYNITTNSQFSSATLGAYFPTHPLMLGVSVLNAYYRLQVTASTGAQIPAYWSDGQPLIAVKGRAVGINAYLGNSSDNWSGDFARVIANAGRWLWLGNTSCEALTCTATKVFQGAITAEDPTQTGRLFRDGIASTCSEPKGTCPGISSPGSFFHFDRYEFLNNSSSNQCVTISLDPKTCAGTQYLQSSAYLGSYDPGSTCSNYLADLGSSFAGPASYSFTVPAWLTYTVVVNEVTADTGCPAYQLTVSANSCPIRRVSLPAVLK